MFINIIKNEHIRIDSIIAIKVAKEDCGYYGYFRLSDGSVHDSRAYTTVEDFYKFLEDNGIYITKDI